MPQTDSTRLRHYPWFRFHTYACGSYWHHWWVPTAWTTYIVRSLEGKWEARRWRYRSTSQRTAPSGPRYIPYLPDESRYKYQTGCPVSGNGEADIHYQTYRPSGGWTSISRGNIPYVLDTRTTVAQYQGTPKAPFPPTPTVILTHTPQQGGGRWPPPRHNTENA